MRDLYELERCLLLLSSANFAVVVATKKEQAKLSKTLAFAKTTLVAVTPEQENTLLAMQAAAFGLVMGEAMTIGGKDHPQNQWIKTVVDRLGRYFNQRAEERWPGLKIP